MAVNDPRGTAGVFSCAGKLAARALAIGVTKVACTKAGALSSPAMYQATNITVGEIAKATGIPVPTIKSWVDGGILTPSHRGVGKGYRHLYSMRDAVAVAVGRDLRTRGLPVESAAAAMRWILASKLADLAARWRVGRKLMLVVGKSVLPVLVTREEIYSNPELDVVAASTTGVPVAVLDLHRAYTELNRRILAHRAGTDDAGIKSEPGALPVENQNDREVAA